MANKENKAAQEPAQELVPVSLARAGKNEEQNLFVSVNGKSWLLPKGKTSMVPPYVAAEISRAEAAQDELNRYIQHAAAQ